MGRHGPFLKGCKLYKSLFAYLFSYDRHASVIRAFENVGVLPLTPCILPLERFPYLFGTCIVLLDYLSLDFFYDEMVSSTEELSNDATKSSLPPSCRNLFLAYHRIWSETKGKGSLQSS